MQAGIYIQDDYRARKDLTVSGGIRQEFQSHDRKVASRAARRHDVVAVQKRKTTVRAGGGIFFDWFDAASYEQAVQLDGAHQRIETILDPGFPDPSSGGRATATARRPYHALRPGSGNRSCAKRWSGSSGRSAAGCVRTPSLIHRTGVNLLRGVNVNAPRADGVRPDPASGVVTLVESIAGSTFDSLIIGMNYARPEQRIFLAANYQLSRSVDDADTPFGLPADSFNLAAERGPATMDARHRVMSLANFPVARRFRIGTSVRIQSGLPYNITTGRDDNGDSISNDRPAGVARNSGRGTAQVDVGAAPQLDDRDRIEGFGRQWRPPGAHRPRATTPIPSREWEAATVSTRGTRSNSTRRGTTF